VADGELVSEIVFELEGSLPFLGGFDTLSFVFAPVREALLSSARADARIDRLEGPVGLFFCMAAGVDFFA